MNIGGQNFTTFSAVNLKGSAAIRFAMDGGFESTLSVKPTLEAARSYVFPDKSGTFGVTGTFSVDLPAITSWGETAVTVTGLRREDALIVQIRDMGNGTVTTGRTFPIIAGARPENGYVYLTFYNPTGTATLAITGMVCSYTTAR